MYLVEPLPRPEYPPRLSPRMQRIMADLSKLVLNMHIHTFNEHYYNCFLMWCYNNYANDVCSVTLSSIIPPFHRAVS